MLVSTAVKLFELHLKAVVMVQVVASCLNTLQPILLEGFRSVHDLRECLRASATVPAVAGEPVSHRDRLLVDAAVFEAIPFRAAIADGCTHVIALATRPPFRWVCLGSPFLRLQGTFTGWATTAMA